MLRFYTCSVTIFEVGNNLSFSLKIKIYSSCGEMHYYKQWRSYGEQKDKKPACWRYNVPQKKNEMFVIQIIDLSMAIYCLFYQIGKKLVISACVLTVGKKQKIKQKNYKLESS